MVVVDIWVEGVADQKFLADVITVWFKITFDKNFTFKEEARQLAVRIRLGNGVSSFTSLEGWEKLKPNFSTLQNLIIADADADFTGRTKAVARTIKDVRFDAETDLFLFPNNQDTGDLESLVEQIVHSGHRAVLGCFEAYENCLRSFPDKAYATPNRKAKVYAYLEALGAEERAEKRDYTNADHWQLDPTSTPLQPLHKFLKKHLGL